MGPPRHARSKDISSEGRVRWAVRGEVGSEARGAQRWEEVVEYPPPFWLVPFDQMGAHTGTRLTPAGIGGSQRTLKRLAALVPNTVKRRPGSDSGAKSGDLVSQCINVALCKPAAVTPTLAVREDPAAFAPSASVAAAGAQPFPARDFAFVERPRAGAAIDTVATGRSGATMADRVTCHRHLALVHTDDVVNVVNTGPRKARCST